jgi:hypothetical protein
MAPQCETILDTETTVVPVTDEASADMPNSKNEHAKSAKHGPE